MKNPFVFLIVLCSIGQTFAQSGSLWTDKPETEMRVAGGQKFFPLHYRTAGLNVDAIQELLASAPDERNISPSKSPMFLEIPTPDGKLDSFRLVEYAMMEPGLANRYSDFGTYRGVDIHDPFKTIRCDWTLGGFSAIVTSPDGRYHVEPYARQNQEDYIIFNKRDYPKPKTPFECDVDFDIREISQGNGSRVAGDCTFRSYRLAVATTGEYSNHFGATDTGDVGLVLSEVVIAVNRVNEVYEKDITVRLILIENTTAVFYYDPDTDPYSGSPCTQLNQNQTTMNSVIGSGNYDMGHVFSVGGGGCAQLAVICSSSKAKGATGLNPPDGDPFYIDYVAHEMGHQFGGNHTQNNSCNRNNATAMEPGSASTIMGYAGICAPDVQLHSDDYFHGISIQEMNNHIAGGSGDNCDVPITWSNSAPVVTPGSDHTIPKSTPYILTATATDADGDPMTYCWEQWDNEVGSMPPSSTNTVGPMFRSLNPDPSPTRYMPRLMDLVNNTTYIWEVLSSVTRDLEFRVSVRDFHNGMAGCTDEDNVLIHVTSTSGPFVVTSPNTSSVQWTEGVSETVTWNVAGTTSSPVSCANVDILLSYDGGFTYPTILASNTPNDGSQTVEVPAGTTTTARVMVKGAGNIFFDISNADFEILSGIPTYSLTANPSTQSICPPGTVDYTILVQSLNGYTDPVTMSEAGHPAGSTVSFSINPVIPGDSSTMSIVVPAGASPAEHELTVNGISLSGPKSTTTQLVVIGEPLVPVLVSPADGATGESLNSSLEWETSSGAEYYAVELSTDVLFSDLVFVDTTSATNVSPGGLDPQTVYYWRVQPVNACATGAWSVVRNFQTASCLLQYSTDVPKVIPSSGQPTITSNLIVSLAGQITDVNVIDLIGTHTYLDDLRFTLTSPASTDVILINRWCGSENDFNIDLDDQAPVGDAPCPYTDGNAYQPEEALSAFNGENATGTWVLTVEDLANQDGGSLNSWALEICVSGGCPVIVTNTADSGNGTLRSALDCTSSGDTITFSPALYGTSFMIVDPLLITSDIHILSAPDQNIILDGSQTTRTFEITALSQASIQGVTIEAGSALSGSGIQNAGELLLKDVTIIPGPLSNDLLLSNTGTLTLEGDCHVSQ